MVNAPVHRKPTPPKSLCFWDSVCPSVGWTRPDRASGVGSGRTHPGCHEDPRPSPSPWSKSLGTFGHSGRNVGLSGRPAATPPPPAALASENGPRAWCSCSPGGWPSRKLATPPDRVLSTAPVGSTQGKREASAQACGVARPPQGSLTSPCWAGWGSEAGRAARTSLSLTQPAAPAELCRLALEHVGPRLGGDGPECLEGSTGTVLESGVETAQVRVSGR